MDDMIEGVSNLLLKNWGKLPEFKGDRANLLLDSPIDLEFGLKLIAAHNRPLAAIIKAATKPEDIIDDVQKAIAEFQSGFTKLRKDGILGRMTFEKLKDVKSCPGEESRPSEDISKASEKLAKQKGGVWYFYYVESIPDVPGPENYSITLLKNAWTRWAMFAGVQSQLLRPDEKEYANVIVKKSFLPGNVLGQAHVGDPPSKFVLTLEIDDRPWTEQLFYNAVCHEIGHILGLEHSSDPTDLMYPHIPTSATGPTDSDGARAAALDWLGPPK